MKAAVGPPLEDAGPEDAPTEELAGSDEEPPTDDASDVDEPEAAVEEEPIVEDATITDEDTPAMDVPALLPTEVAPADDEDPAALEETPWEEEPPTLLARELDAARLLDPAPEDELPPAAEDAPMDDDVVDDPDELLLESPPPLVHAPTSPTATHAQMRFMRFGLPVKSKWTPTLTRTQTWNGSLPGLVDRPPCGSIMSVEPTQSCRPWSSGPNPLRCNGPGAQVLLRHCDS